MTQESGRWWRRLLRGIQRGLSDWQDFHNPRAVAAETELTALRDELAAVKGERDAAQARAVTNQEALSRLWADCREADDRATKAEGLAALGAKHIRWLRDYASGFEGLQSIRGWSAPASVLAKAKELDAHLVAVDALTTPIATTVPSNAVKEEST